MKCVRNNWLNQRDSNQTLYCPSIKFNASTFFSTADRSSPNILTSSQLTTASLNAAVNTMHNFTHDERSAAYNTFTHVVFSTPSPLHDISYDMQLRAK